jgi:hypothetical protein
MILSSAAISIEMSETFLRDMATFGSSHSSAELFGSFLLQFHEIFLATMLHVLH